MGLFKKLFSILQGDSEEKDIENLSGTSNSQETNCSEEKKHQAKSKVKKEVSKTSQEPIREQKEFYTNEIENSDKESVNLEELSLEELEEMQKKLEVDGKEARRRGDKKAEEKLHSEWRKVRSAVWIKEREKKAKEETVAKAKAEEEAVNPTLVDSEIANQLTDGGKNKNVILPASVCEIAPKAFFDNKTLERIDMTSCNKLTIIGELAFARCENLTNIIFPENIEEIGGAAFSNCEALASVDLSNCKKLDKIGESAFNWCPSLEEVLLPESLSSIGKSAFYGCKIRNIDFSACKLLSKFPDSLFKMCKSLEEVVWPPHLKEIGWTAFSNCEALASVDLSNCKKLDKIGESAFNWCPSLEEVLLPESLSSIGKSAFYGCKIRNIDFSACKLLSKFPDSLFNMCKSLEEVVWPPHLKEIGDVAFSDCESLRRVELPDSVEVLGEQVFSGCKLKSLSLPKNIKKLPVLTVAVRAEDQIKSLDMSRCKNLKVLTAPITCSSKTIVFPVGVEEIEADVFKYNYKLGQFESIFLPPTIKEVELNNSANKANVYCYAPELENVKDIIEKCACLLVLPQYYDSYYDQAVAEGAEGYLDKIPEDKLYFYDE